MSDDLEQRYAEAIANAECEKRPRCADCMADSVKAVRDEEMERLRAQLREAADALCDVGKMAIVVKSSLEKPYPDAPDWSPWTRFMGAPAKRAYNLGHQIRAAVGRNE